MTDQPFADGCGNMRCQECGRYTPIWRAPNELWDQVMRAPDAPIVACPICFIRRAERLDVNTVWMLSVYDDVPYAAADLHQVDAP